MLQSKNCLICGKTFKFKKKDKKKKYCSLKCSKKSFSEQRKGHKAHNLIELTEEQIKELYARYINKEPIKEIHSEYGISMRKAYYLIKEYKNRRGIGVNGNTRPLHG